MAKTAKPVGRGGKRKGAGRKPGSTAGEVPKDANFNARIDRQTLALLKKEAEAAGITASALAGDLISRGLRRKRDERFDAPARGLSFLVATIASRTAEVWIEQDDDTRQFLTWHDDPFMFEAVRLAIMEVMDRIRPAGAVVLPSKRHPKLKGFDHLFGPLETAGGRAAWAAQGTLRELMVAKKETRRVPDGTAAERAAKWQALEYGFADARRDLGLDDKKLFDLVKGEQK